MFPLFSRIPDADTTIKENTEKFAIFPIRNYSLTRTSVAGSACADHNNKEGNTA
jgi:hypothetical protein